MCTKNAGSENFVQHCIHDPLILLILIFFTLLNKFRSFERPNNFFLRNVGKYNFVRQYKIDMENVHNFI